MFFVLFWWIVGWLIFGWSLYGWKKAQLPVQAITNSVAPEPCKLPPPSWLLELRKNIDERETQEDYFRNNCSELYEKLESFLKSEIVQKELSSELKKNSGYRAMFSFSDLDLDPSWSLCPINLLGELVQDYFTAHNMICNHNLDSKYFWVSGLAEVLGTISSEQLNLTSNTTGPYR